MIQTKIFEKFLMLPTGFCLAIGIDPGVKTGIAIKNIETGEYLLVKTMKIHEAIELVRSLYLNYVLYVVVEDARKRTWFGKTGAERWKGAGSIMRDCKIWEDLLNSLGIRSDFRKPQKGQTKIPHEYFEKVTGWTGSSSEHSRDAGMLIQGVNKRNLKLLFIKYEK